MSELEFRCPDCGQEISVNNQMRTAILENGCPVCAAVADASDFE